MIDLLPSPRPGLTVSFNYLNAQGQVWNLGSLSWVTWSDGDYAVGAYSVSATEIGGGLYSAVTPDGVGTAYLFVARQVVDQTAAHDLVIGSGAAQAGAAAKSAGLFAA